MLNFRLELLRQAMAERMRRRLKDSRARSQAIAMQYGSFSRSASSDSRLWSNMRTDAALRVRS